MEYLDKLQISNRVIAASRSRRKIETPEYRRNKLIASIEEQIELARLALNNQPLELQRKRGHKVVKVRPRIWWKLGTDGVSYSLIRYNKADLNLGGRGNTLEVGPLNKLPEVYQTVIDAVKAGELDQSIENAARKS